VSPIRGGEEEEEEVEEVKPALGFRKNFRNSYYTSLKLHTPSPPSSNDMAAILARNSELRRMRSVEREKRMRSNGGGDSSVSSSAPMSAAAVSGERAGGGRERTELPRRRLDFEQHEAGALTTSSGRSATLGALASEGAQKGVAKGGAAATVTKSQPTTPAPPGAGHRYVPIATTPLHPQVVETSDTQEAAQRGEHGRATE
jgi:hypothetical protein